LPADTYVSADAETSREALCFATAPEPAAAVAAIPKQKKVTVAAPRPHSTPQRDLRTAVSNEKRSWATGMYLRIMTIRGVAAKRRLVV
jgi:hypothetical protein